MTMLLAVAAGDHAADELERIARRQPHNSGVTVVRHGDFVVAYASTNRWVSAFDDGDVLIVLDGRIHQPRLAPDTAARELHTRYRASGDQLAAGLLGDFVLVVLDRTRNTLVVARDPLGVRPWYRSSKGRLHGGASDIATLASTGWVDTAINEPVVIRRLAAITGERGETVYTGIESLRPGQTWCLQDGRSRTFAHHEWRIEPDLETTWDDACERCRELLKVAIRDRLTDAEPATSELSGGLDSSVVVGTLALMGRRDLVAARLVFETPRADERIYSDAVAEHWGVPVISAPPWIPTSDEIAHLTRELAQPIVDPHFTMFATLDHALLEAQRPLGLTGLGGDDAFAACSNGSRVVSTFQLHQRTELRQLCTYVVRHPRAGLREVVLPALHHLNPWSSGPATPWVSREARDCADVVDRLRHRPPRYTGVAAIDERIANLTSGYTASILEERAVVADATGRRKTHPFLDPRFIEATYGWNPWWPTYIGHPRSLQVAAYADRLPRLVAARRTKADFSEVFWPQLLDDSVLTAIATGPLHDLGWLDPDGFARLVANAKRGTAQSAIPLSRCRSIDQWLRSLR